MAPQGIIISLTMRLLAATLVLVAAAHYEDSLAFCRKAGYQPEEAWTCCDYADMLLERSQSVRGELVEPPVPDVLR